VVTIDRAWKGDVWRGRGLGLLSRGLEMGDMSRCILHCMSTRTQVYLTDEQRRRIDELANAAGVTMAEIIRRALDGYLDDQADPEPSLAATFGAAPDFSVPTRDEWDRG